MQLLSLAASCPPGSSSLALKQVQCIQRCFGFSALLFGLSALLWALCPALGFGFGWGEDFLRKKGEYGKSQ